MSEIPTRPAVACPFCRAWIWESEMLDGRRCPRGHIVPLDALRRNIPAYPDPIGGKKAHT